MSPETTILFTGTDPERFKNLGRIIHQPMIAIAPLDDYSALDREIARLETYDWIIFTSRCTVKYFCERLRKTPKEIISSKVCALGRSTARVAREHGLNVDRIPRDESSEGITALFKTMRLQGKNILIPRSNLAGNVLPASLTEMGAVVTAITAYNNIKPGRIDPVDLSGIDEIFFTSPSTFRNFREYYKEIPCRIKIRCIGSVTCSAVREGGFQGEVVSL